MTRVAVVTGSNKGVGFGLVRALCKEFDGDVFLTARDVGRGTEAVDKLKAEGLDPKFHQLDIDNDSSVDALRDYLQKNYSGVDILINNAAIAYAGASTAPFLEQAEVSLRTNFWGTLRVCDALFPLLKSHARVVNISSMVLMFGLRKCSEDRRKQLMSCSTVEDLQKSITQFVDDVRDGTHKDKGWPQMAYGVSKIGVTLLTRIQQRMIDEDKTKTDVVINCCCPGFVDTDMSNHKGILTIEQGAVTPLYLALLPPNIDSPHGEHLSDKKIFDLSTVSSSFYYNIYLAKMMSGYIGTYVKNWIWGK